jgi:hypothetical protein
MDTSIENCMFYYLYYRFSILSLPKIFIGGGPIFPHAARPWVSV